MSKTDALFTLTSILFVHTSRITELPIPRQMETLYTEDLCTDLRLNECRSTVDTLTRRRNAAIVRLGANHSGELCLNPISLVSCYFYIRRGLRDQLPFAIDFLTPSFGSQPSLRRLRPFPPLFANLYFFTSLLLHLHSCHLDFCTLTFSSPASVAASISQTWHVCISEGGGEGWEKIRHFRIPSASISLNS